MCTRFYESSYFFFAYIHSPFTFGKFLVCKAGPCSLSRHFFFPLFLCFSSTFLAVTLHSNQFSYVCIIQQPSLLLSKSVAAEMCYYMLPLRLPTGCTYLPCNCIDRHLSKPGQTHVTSCRCTHRFPPLSNTDLHIVQISH